MNNRIAASPETGGKTNSMSFMTTRVYEGLEDPVGSRTTSKQRQIAAERARATDFLSPAWVVRIQLLALATMALAFPLPLLAQGTAFTYQGRLSNSANPVTGIYDLTFTLCSVSNGVGQVGTVITNAAMPVTNGVFLVTLDFGATFTGPDRWLEIGVRTNGGGAFTILAPRQKITPTPYAMFANAAGNLSGTLPATQLSGSLQATQISGTLSLAQLPAAVVTNNGATLTVGGTNQISALTVPPNLPASAVSSISAALSPVALTVVGNFAYLVDQSGYLRISDVSLPANPIGLGGVLVGGGGGLPTSLAVAGRYAYVVNMGGNNLRIVDVSNPSAPVLAGSAGVGNNAQSIAVAGRYAYVLYSGGNTLNIFDVGNPTAPISVGSVGTDSNPAAIALNGRYAYVVNSGSNTLQVFNVANPAAPVSLGSVTTSNMPLSIAVAGRYAYVTGNSGRFQIFDLSNYPLPASVGSASIGANAHCVAVAGRYAYIVSYSANTLQVFDVSNPAAPASAGTTSTGTGGPMAVAVAGRYAYMVNILSNTLQVYELGGAYLQHFEAGTTVTGTLQSRDTVSVGKNLDVSGGLTVSGSARISGGLSVDNGTVSAGNFLGSFIGNGAGLSSLNIVFPTAINANSLAIGPTNLVAPFTVPPNVPASGLASTSTGAGSNPSTVAVSGRYAYVVNSSSNTLQIFDVNTPAAPASLGTVATGNSPWAVTVAGRYAYVANAGGNTLQVIDVSNPSAPVSVGSINMGAGSSPNALAVSGHYAYVANLGSNTLQIIDVGNPAAPASVGLVGTSNQPVSVAVSGCYAYVLCNAGALQVINVSNASAPVVVGSAVVVSPTCIAVSGRYAYVLQGSLLRTFDVGNPAAPAMIGAAGTGNTPYSIVVAGRFAYVANFGSSTLQLFDISIPYYAVSLGTVNTGNGPHGLAVSGRYAYVVNYSDGSLQAFDLGGAFVQQLEAGLLEVGSLQTRDAVKVGNSLDVRGGLTASGGARITGGLSVNNGPVGIGVSAPSYSLQVNGSVAGVGAYNNLSDARFKTNVVRLSGALDKIQAMRGVQFDWRTKENPQMHFDNRAQLGFVAQEIKDIVPEAVSQDAEGYYSIAYSMLIPVLVEALKEQQREITTRDTQLQLLNQRLEKLERIICNDKP
ncbi:MAG: tail fiber domain-containing protein [Verrucomicrobiota bacterium]